ncbi:MAG: primosomal protein N' [Bacillota bacterium]
MIKYAKVVVDVPFTERNKFFDYKIPDFLLNKIGIGNLVLVPFGKRSIKAFVISIKDKVEISDNKIKNIKKLYKKERFFNKKDLKLYQWMADYYSLNLISVIRAAVPAGVFNNNISKKRKKYISLNSEIKEIKKVIKNIENKAPKQKEVLKVLLKNQNSDYTKTELAKKAETYPGTVNRLIKKGYIKSEEKIERRKPFLEKKEEEKESFEANYYQQKAIDIIEENILNSDTSKSYLLHGVTGSGKTEVYLQLVEKILNKKQGAIILVPEISLAPVMVRRFYSRFGDKIAVLHSNLSTGERYDEWLRLKNGEAQIAIGARSAIFAPIKNLGIIIIDEEHENSYKQSSYPYYHAREVGVKRAKINGIPLVLGSATPSLKSYYLAQKKYFKYLSLPERINKRDLPPVNIIDMRDEMKEGNLSIFSQKLKNNIEKALTRNEQILLFLNRRGYSSFALCRECGHVLRCENCDISLTYHDKENLLKCHYCDYHREIPRFCPECGSEYIKKFGIGTEKLEEEVKKYFPEAEVDRMDIDTTTQKGSHRKILNRLENNKTDILIGTQMITKGHDYPGISVVGVITADTILNLPDFRSAERTFQLITQVAGRTGRGDINGEVIVQTYTPGHYSIQAARKHDYQKFYKKEVALRKQLNYPPFTKLVNIIVEGENNDEVIKAANDLGSFFDSYQAEILELLGPSPAPIEKLRGKYRWQIILKFSKYKERKYLLKEIRENFLPYKVKSVKFNIDVDPISML